MDEGTVKRGQACEEGLQAQWATLLRVRLDAGKLCWLQQLRRLQRNFLMQASLMEAALEQRGVEAVPTAIITWSKPLHASHQTSVHIVMQLARFHMLSSHLAPFRDF